MYRDLPRSPVVRTSPSNAAGVGSIPGQEAKIPHASWPKNQNIKQKQYCNKFSKTLNMVHIKKSLKKKKIYAYIYMHIHTHKYVYVYKYMYIYIYIYNVCVYIYVYVVYIFYHK